MKRIESAKIMKKFTEKSTKITRISNLKIDKNTWLSHINDTNPKHCGGGAGGQRTRRMAVLNLDFLVQG